MRSCMLLIVVVVAFGPCLFAAEGQLSAAPSVVPGVVVAHSPASSRIYIGSAGIARLSDGAYLMKHDEFGEGSTEYASAITRVYRSTDRGQNWQEIAKIDGLFWSNIFEHHGAVYMIGPHHHHGSLLVVKSTDSGRTWSTPRDGKSGLIRAGKFHTAPMPVIAHDGRLWRAVEDGDGPGGWGEMYRPRVMSIAVDGDLLDADQWTLTNPIERDGKWLGGDFWNTIEGNVVVDRDGVVRNILRSNHDDTAAVTTVSADGKTQTVDPKFDRTSLPGSSKKVLIRWDEPSQLYWALSNPPTPSGAIRSRGTRWPCSRRPTCAGGRCGASCCTILIAKSMRFNTPTGSSKVTICSSHRGRPMMMDWVGPCGPRRQLPHVSPLSELPPIDDGRRRPGR